MQNSPIKRRGFTLVEFLCIAGIVAMLTALVPSALQNARVAARQTICRNNLKQIGLAMHNYLEVYRTFPPGWVAKTPHPGNGPRFGWMTFLLPYVEQFALYDQMNFEAPMPPAGHEDNGNRRLQTHVEVYRCPSDSTSITNPMRGDYGTANYSGNHGSLSLPRWTTGRQTALWPGQVDTPLQANGILYLNSNVRIQDVTDGLSNTILVGERCVTSAAGIWPGVGSNEMENDAVTECSHASRLNRGPTSFSSPHGGVVQFLLGDGTVRTINENINSEPNTQGELGILQRLANRHDGLVVGEY